MRTHKTKNRPLLVLIGIAFALLFGGWGLVRPVYAITEHSVVCPADGNGSVDALKAALLAAHSTPQLDAIVINVTGADCVFTLVKIDPNTSSLGMPVIHYDLIIRAVGGRAIIERSPSAPAFSLMRTVGALTLENLTLRNGVSFSDRTGVAAPGGAIYGQAMTLTNVLLTNNESDAGGALYVSGPLVLNHVTATQNRTRTSSQASGGAIVALDTLRATNITVTNNVAAYPGIGGGIYVYGNATISSSLFTGNQANERAGGGLQIYGDATIANSAFMSNSAGENGGGIFVTGNLALSESDFASNSAGENGGGLYVTGDLALSSSLLVGNSSAMNGGGVFVGGSPFVSNTQFLRNVAGGSGGGLGDGEEVMAAQQANMARIEASIFISNQAAYGGGAQIQSGIVRNNLFEQNIGRGSGPYYGGGALMATSQATIQDNRFVRNIAPLGGAVHLMFYPLGAPGSTSLIANNLLIDNDASQGSGGAIAVGVNLDVFQGGYVEIKHNTIVQKKRGTSSALYVANSTADIGNNIIVRHRIGIHAIGPSILADANLLQDNTTNYVGIVGGPKELIADPLFINPTNDDYHLQSGSPAQNSGLDLDVELDFDGVPRPQGKGYDRGAFEIIEVNHAPLGLSDTYETSVDTTLVISAPGVLLNDSDPEGDLLTATIADIAAHGDVMLQSNGAFIYTPTIGFTGTDSFTYQVKDGSNSAASVLVTINIKGDVDGPPAQPVAIASLKVTQDGPAVKGHQINFVASVEAGSNVEYAWDFGDNAASVRATVNQGGTVSHTYAEPGEYSVTVTASNSLGDEVATTKVTVLPDSATQQQLFLSRIQK